MIDLHAHSLYSDGSDTPTEIVAQARLMGLHAIAITDHDNFGGLQEAAAASEKLGIEFVPGVELSSVYAGEPVHLLAYYMDTESASLRALMQRAVDERRARNETLVRKLHDAGYPIDMDELREEYPGQDMLGRPHIAEHLMKLGVVPSIRSGVIELMGKGSPFYVPRYHVPLEDYISAVREAGGVPVIAHIFQYRFDDKTRQEMLRHAINAGLLGVEGFYSGYTARQTFRVHHWARQYHLICTGGSDYHGTRKPNINLGTGRGRLHVPDSALHDLKTLHAEIH